MSRYSIFHRLNKHESYILLYWDSPASTTAAFHLKRRTGDDAYLVQTSSKSRVFRCPHRVRAAKDSAFQTKRGTSRFGNAPWAFTLRPGLGSERGGTDDRVQTSAGEPSDHSRLRSSTWTTAGRSISRRGRSGRVGFEAPTPIFLALATR